MIAAIRDWVLGLTGAALFCAVATALTPDGPVKGVVKTLCGVVMAAALLTPLFSFDFPSYALYLAEARRDAAEITVQAEEISDSLSRTIIAERLEAYILDKAAELGANVTEAEVTLQWSTEGAWYPSAVTLSGNYNAALSDCIEGELGIPQAAQTWRDNANG